MSVGKKLQNQNMSGLIPMLRTKCPDFEWEITRDTRHSWTTIILTCEGKNNQKAFIKFQINDLEIETHPEIISDFLDDSIKKLREYCEKPEPKEENNPSSRWYGIWK